MYCKSCTRRLLLKRLFDYDRMTLYMGAIHHIFFSYKTCCVFNLNGGGPWDDILFFRFQYSYTISLTTSYWTQLENKCLACLGEKEKLRFALENSNYEKTEQGGPNFGRRKTQTLQIDFLNFYFQKKIKNNQYVLWILFLDLSLINAAG